ncbi:GIY-YIG nuclease family protein [Bacillus xiapuensis]|uniref:NUMOD3 domain-containing DNA-binding protein n=1 Tax=Bacillus xiapuensis TaxID=2014075 RepID=A0ABU6N9X6_9BACI|nr:NUMOD3 domain-containing DNA-binding protein [Bacillus xiapuensis]
MNKSGIYKIINITNNLIYIGSATNLRIRQRTHFYELKRNIHKNSYLQNAWNKYGEENFKFEVIELVDDKEKLLEREQYWINKYESYIRSKGYNLTPTAGSMLGYKMSDEAKKKISNSKKGTKMSKEFRLKRSEYRKGEKHSEETKKKIGNSNKGKRLGKEASEETRKKMSESQKKRKGERSANYGKKWSEETKKKISEANKGKTPNDETRKKISEALKGRVKTEEEKRKISESNKGKTAGEKNGKSKVNEDQVKYIRYLFLKEKQTIHDIIEVTGLSYNIVYKIVNFISWKHVELIEDYELPIIK